MVDSVNIDTEFVEAPYNCSATVEVFSAIRDGVSNAALLNYSLEENTFDCVRAQSQFPLLSLGSQNRPCDDADLDVTISSALEVVDGIFPAVRINISALIHIQSSMVFFRYHCLDAPDQEDIYCHGLQEDRGHVNSPCRSLFIMESHLLHLPFRFAYLCFHIFGQSHYFVNVSLVPKMCTSSFIVTTPRIKQLYPSTAKIFDPTLSSVAWSPLVVVDLTPNDGVWLRYEPPADQVITHVYFAVFEDRGVDNRFLFEEVLAVPDNGFKWTNVPAGNYSAYVYIRKENCRLICNGKGAIASGCTICPHTAVKFAVASDRFTLVWRNLRSVANFARVFAAILLGVVGVVAVGVFTMVGYARLMRLKRRRFEHDVLLCSRPQVLLVYTHDCNPHSSCVLALANLLSECANAHVYIDQVELTVPGIVPTRWLVQTFAKVQFVLVVFSEGSSVVLNGRMLASENPFPDLFDTVINHVVSELNEYVSLHGGSSSREINKRFIFLHMSYSPPSVIPAHIAAFPVRVLSLPSQINELIALIHEQPVGSDVIFNADSTNFSNSVEEVVKFRKENPSWLFERIKVRSEKDDIQNGLLNATELIPIRHGRAAPTFDEQVRIANELNLEPPDDDETNQESGFGGDDSRFALIGSPDDASSSDTE